MLNKFTILYKCKEEKRQLICSSSGQRSRSVDTECWGGGGGCQHCESQGKKERKKYLRCDGWHGWMVRACVRWCADAG